MADQVDLDESWYGVVPVGPRAHRDLAFEQGAGLGAERPLTAYFLRSGANRRSMVAADMPTSSAAVSSSMSNSPNRRSTATNSPSIGASLLPAGIPNTDQHNTSAATAFGPYFGGRGRRAPTTRGRSAPRNALRA